MGRKIGYINIEQARGSGQFPVKDWVGVGCGRVVVWDVAMKDVGEDEGGGTIADDDGVDSGRDWLGSHLRERVCSRYHLQRRARYQQWGSCGCQRS